MPEERRQNLAETDRGSYYQTRKMVRGIGRTSWTIEVHFFKIEVLKKFANPQENNFIKNRPQLYLKTLLKQLY